jgi:uncharacterized protein YbjT (DUF2867 family)
MVLGATGLVGGLVVSLALEDPRISVVVAPTRRPVAPRPGLENPIVDFDALDPAAPWWHVDAVISALGTTTRATPSHADYERIESTVPVAVARLTKAGGASAFAYVSSLGASPTSRSTYLRRKGLAEQRLREVGVASLTLVRPAGISGPRQPPRPAEQLTFALMRAVAPLLPRRWRVVSGLEVARALLESVLSASPGVHVVESEALH